eukprot:SAG31_NODE_773_length_12173_cov_15.778173_7_plen_160_part_00
MSCDDAAAVSCLPAVPSQKRKASTRSLRVSQSCYVLETPPSTRAAIRQQIFFFTWRLFRIGTGRCLPLAYNSSLSGGATFRVSLIHIPLFFVNAHAVIRLTPYGTPNSTSHDFWVCASASSMFLWKKISLLSSVMAYSSTESVPWQFSIKTLPTDFFSP